MVYRIKKTIVQYNLVDLLEITQYPNHPDHSIVKTELRRRNPSIDELKLARKELVFRNKTRRKPLSFIDMLYCILTPLVAPKNKFTASTDVENSYEDQLAEFEYYNESKKANQLKRCKSITDAIFGILALLFFVTLIILAFIYGI